MKDPRLLGDIAEQKFILFCMQNNINIYKPINSNGRVDFIIEINNKLKKVQIKYRSVNNNKLCLSASKQQNGREKILKYKKDEIDLFLVYEPVTDLFYNIPVELYEKNKVHVFRVNPPKNNQIKSIKYLKNFIFTI